MPYSDPLSSVAGHRYALYARKSTEEDERQCQSIESQSSRVHDISIRYGKKITHVVTESRSAKEPGRTEFNRLLALIDAGEIDGVLAWHPDRLARNELDAAAITWRLRKGVLKDLHFAEFFFHNSPEGIMMLQSALSQSQYQVSKLAIDVKRGIDDKIKKGWYPHRAPLGYRNDTHKFKGDKSISPDPVRFVLVRKAWDILLTGVYSVPQIVVIMNNTWGFRTPLIVRSGRGGEPVAQSTLYRMFENIFYAGMFEHGGTIYQGAHPPMITLAEFEQAQKILGRVVKGAGHTQPLNTPRTWERPFVGLIRCGYCDSQITATTVNKSSGKQYTYYHCCRGLGACRKRGVREEVLEAMIDQELTKWDAPPLFYEWAHLEVETTSEAQRKAGQEMQNQRQRAVQEMNGMLDGLLNLAVRGILPEEEFQRKRNELVLTRAKLMEEIQAHEQAGDLPGRYCRNALAYMKNVREWLQNGDCAMKRIVARNLGSNFVLKDGNLLLEPHPMLKRVQWDAPKLVVKYHRIELGDYGSYSTKKAALAAVRRTWSRTWEAIRTNTANPGWAFPDVATEIQQARSEVVSSASTQNEGFALPVPASPAAQAKRRTARSKVHQTASRPQGSDAEAKRPDEAKPLDFRE